jgi:hypothetical protein
MNVRTPLLRPLAATVAFFAFALAWMLWSTLHAARLTDGLALAPGRNHFAVTLDFAPEAFHVTRLQAIGRVVEVRGPTVFMMDVDPTAMRDFAAYYWVREIAIWPGR